jgi:hypothetical protein
LKVNILKSNQNVFLFYFIEKKWVFNFAIKIVQNFAIKMKTIKECLDELISPLGRVTTSKLLKKMSTIYIFILF